MRIKAGDWVYIDFVDNPSWALNGHIAQVAYTQESKAAVNLDEVTLRVLQKDGGELFVGVPERALIRVPDVLSSAADAGVT